MDKLVKTEIDNTISKINKKSTEISLIQSDIIIKQSFLKRLRVAEYVANDHLYLPLKDKTIHQLNGFRKDLKLLINPKNRSDINNHYQSLINKLNNHISQRKDQKIMILDKLRKKKMDLIGRNIFTNEEVDKLIEIVDHYYNQCECPVENR